MRAAPCRRARDGRRKRRSSGRTLDEAADYRRRPSGRGMRTPMACSLRILTIRRPARDPASAKFAAMSNADPTLPLATPPTPPAVAAARPGAWRGLRLPAWLRPARWPRIRSGIGLRLALLALALGLPFVV